MGVDPALVLRVDEQRRLEVCVWLNRVGRLGQRRSRVASKKCCFWQKFWLSFCWFRGATFERTEEEEGEPAAGIVAGREGEHALLPVVAALLPRPLLRRADELALEVHEKVPELVEPGRRGGDCRSSRGVGGCSVVDRSGARRGDVRWWALVLGPVSLRRADHAARLGGRHEPDREGRGEGVGLASVVTRSFGSGVHAGALLGDSNSNPEASNDAIITPSTSSHTTHTGFGSSEKTKGCPVPNRLFQLNELLGSFSFTPRRLFDSE